MTHAVIYARFSTDLQNEKSTEDQIALCRAHAARRGLQIIQTFEDKARSGGSILGRDGLTRLMDAARTRTFDVVVVEALDRLSRDMEDLAGIHKRLSFLGIEIDAVHDGTADSILVGIRGLVGQMQREDGAKKVRRGMAGVVRDGRAGMIFNELYTGRIVWNKVRMVKNPDTGKRISRPNPRD